MDLLVFNPMVDDLIYVLIGVHEFIILFILTVPSFKNLKQFYTKDP